MPASLDINLYKTLNSVELDRKILSAKEKLGSELLILGHHYMSKDVLKFADFKGDSFRLSQQAAESKAKYIVFGGVFFMAETADILTSEEQTVILPDLQAGCAMADMADANAINDCWYFLQNNFPGEVIPIVYINSSAELKAFCGKNGGTVCTSSSADRALRWAFEQGKRVLFFPDEHLGRNTGKKLGLSEDSMAVWDRQNKTLSGNAHARLFLWNGFCPIHLKFTEEHIQKVRNNYPGINVIVHPECSNHLVKLADSSGSTEHIAKVIAESPAGSQWAVGTEINMVQHLAEKHTDKLIIPLSETVEPCMDMSKIGRENLLWCLENLLGGNIVNQVKLTAQTASGAKLALDRMLSIK
ncbi:quinolinate synthetase complex, A subunit [Desulfofarcimen acetoxidans DSM 771]|uniref:Quinolinate synthase n=1 Tax=Desulfofarcimen acetoxidans (strain ATCC 49208 / DSM 771 / KCTC 5769 / VKM B-1644 / 5575) TaxID=485916 RepID=C8VZT9_DESAS|nr:quinolinate synthase NadA [Desulfofarcimen acetoxidans]ACV63067.1 quinolinate synthetase complex, A subunit [Desulfofarcimen acetoxidans DSM 771]